MNLLGIVDYMKYGEGVMVKCEIFVNYVWLLESVKVFYKCLWFDLCLCRLLRGGEKYYFVDPGIWFVCNVGMWMSYGLVLENVLYVYLRLKVMRWVWVLLVSWSVILLCVSRNGMFMCRCWWVCRILMLRSVNFVCLWSWLMGIWNIGLVWISC